MYRKRKQNTTYYTRVSTAIRVNGYSLDAQKDKLKKYAEFQDMETIEEYSYERHSGKNIKGLQEFMQMLNNSEDGKDGFDFGLVVKLCDAEETERRFNHAKKWITQTDRGICSRNIYIHSQRRQERNYASGRHAKRGGKGLLSGA